MVVIFGAPLPCSVLMWHRSENLAFVLVLGGAADIAVGTHASCIIKGVLQVCGVCVFLG